MEILRGLASAHRACQQHALAVGTFQGVHLGHQALLQQLKSYALPRGLRTCVVLLYCAPEQRLLAFRDQISALHAAQVDVVICLRQRENSPDLVFQQIKPAVFMASDAADWMDAAQRCSTDVLQPRPVSEPIKLVETLRAHQFAALPALLGRPYSFSGRVVHGDKKGRELGFPTANLFLRNFIPPITGVFAVSVVINDYSFYGVANLGTRPSVGGKTFRFEVHIFDFQGYLYGQHICVTPHYKIRDEKKFETLAALQTQISDDVAAAKQWFAAHPILDEMA